MVLREDLEQLAGFDFEDRNEADIKAEWIEPLLRLLGYGSGTRHRVLRETNLRLANPLRTLGRKSIRIDFLPTVYGERLWIIEAKPPSADLFSDEHLAQAWCYATHPTTNVPLMVLCDGQRLGVFDVSLENWEQPVFDCINTELPVRFDELTTYIGARQVADRIRAAALNRLEQALAAQIAVEPIDQTVKDVGEIVKRVRPVVMERRREIRREAREVSAARGQEAIEAAGMWGHAQHVNSPFPFPWIDVDRAVEIVRDQLPLLRKREFDAIEASTTRKGESSSRMWFPLRVLRLATAVQLADDERYGEYFSKTAYFEARQLLNGYPDDPLGAAAFRLQRALGPLGWRLAAANKEQIFSASQERKIDMDEEEWLRLDGQIGISPEKEYVRHAMLTPTMMLARVDPWTEESISQAAEVAEALVDELGTPAGFENLQPAGDPWLNSWLTGNPVLELTIISLNHIANQATFKTSADFARLLIERHGP